MYVISGSNKRIDTPLLDMGSMFILNQSKEWKHSSSASPVDVMLTDMVNKLSVTIKIRGYVHDVSHRNSVESRLTEVFIGKNRIPVIDTSIIERRGNKIIVDMTFVVSIPDVEVIDEKTWSFRLSTPSGFNITTLISHLTPVKYIYALVSDPVATATDVSPVSFTLMWPHSPNPPVITVNSKAIELPRISSNVLRIVSQPETDYVCVIDNGSKIYEVVLRTPLVSKESYSTHYRSCRLGTGEYDLTDTSQDVIRDLRKFGVIQPGDKVVLKGVSSALTAVGSGETICDSGLFYVIPSFTENTDQFLCMETPEGSHVLTFDNTESFVGYNSTKYCYGDKFVIGSRMVEVAKGSLILIIHDDVPLEFPGGVTTASQVITAGDIVLRDLIMKSSHQVTAKVDGDSTYGYSSYFVYDPVNGTTLEASRVQHGLNDVGDSGSMSFSVLYTPSTGVQTIHSALEIDPSKTKISTIDNSGALEATFDSTGLRFNSDSGDVYFGAAQEFRIHYEPSTGGDPSMLQIQGFDSSVGEYITRQLITNEPVG